MGGCCCSCRKAHLHGAPCPPVLEEQESLRSLDVTASTISAGLLVHWDLEASIPDTYRPPPPPLPYDMVFGCSRSTDSDSARETISCSSFDTSATCGDLGESDCKVQESSLDISPKKLELSKSNEPHVLEKEDEDVCPICLEGALPSIAQGTNFFDSMKQRIQSLSQNANTTITSRVSFSGWKEVIPVLYVIRKSFHQRRR
ncbi:probable E3 ubiquitin-protein ligase RHB1A isoform X2 [Malus domestica]|uniref:probable E3 ubiquitin-protein ligase RHB1A isoform X2 n=1 Tax=Malus domestica TaxID=3750 RepID=UPI0039749D90